MALKMNIFGKVIILVFLLLTPIIILYGYSHQVSIDVVRESIDNSNRNRLAFFISQLESSVDQLTKFSVIASRDPMIKEYLADSLSYSPVQRVQKQLRIVEMLNLQIATSGWNNQIILHFKDTKDVISTDYSVVYNEDYVQNAELQKWFYRKNEIYGTDHVYFSRFGMSDYPNLLIEVRFTEDNIKNMLYQLKEGGKSEPFFYRNGVEPIFSKRTSDQILVHRVGAYLNNQKLGNSGSQIVTFDQQRYMVNYVRSESLDWYLVDYVPLQNILSPIQTSRNLFYFSVALLLGLSTLASLLLYRNVQKPIKLLLQGVKRIKNGQYSTRLGKQPNNEFDYLFVSFNEMAEKIQELIEKVYIEELRSKEATLKQLQSQINPHFLYNCLFYIKSMANLGQKEAVVSMALNLGEYYRYTTRLEQTMTTLREEMRLVENYFQIQNMRIERFRYEICIPEHMLDLKVPRLLIQPLIENAVIHGVEQSVDFGIIQVTGDQVDRKNRIVIDDNGAGMSNQALLELQRKIALPMEKEMGCGLWNVHQRLIHLFIGQSGLYFSLSPLGGFRVELMWEESETTLNGGSAC